MQIRRATVADVPAMGRIINDCAELGQMLPKSQAVLYENIREFHVAEMADAEGAMKVVVGVCGLSVVWANLAECASLAVDPAFRGHGIGRKLVEVCLQEARDLGIRRVMTLTYEQAFFERCGFSVVDRTDLPLKVWSECVRCPKNQACDEIAMIREFEDIPEPPEASKPPKPVHYEVPVVLTTKGKPSGGGA